MHALRSLLILATLASLSSCGSKGNPPDPSVVVEGGTIDKNVQNGTAYDRAVVDLGNAQKVVLPDMATVHRVGKDGKFQLFMAKTLGFAGHPPQPMNVGTARKNMGCSVRMESNALVIATYGEWDSHIEGGASMKLVAVVPEAVQVEQRTGLSGPHSAAVEWNNRYVSKPSDARGGYWYGPASPAEGWKAVPAVPDPERTAGK